MTLFFTLNFNAQEFNKETVEKDLKNGVLNFYSSISIYYKQGINEREFYQSLTSGIGFKNQSEVAKNLLNESFKLLSYNSKTADVENKLFKPFSIFVKECLVLIDNGRADNLDHAASILFGFSDDFSDIKNSPNVKGPNGEIIFTNSVKCKWYQFGCHVKWLLGTKEGRDILKILIEIIKLL